ncbi:permease-like cell division protein FtsX [[Clostridium] fimetarium]|uniref:Cell division protein FtsX n=1 Tax=[Clostridium] fimetarium TaxID=99656 RepID=A0A1I0M6G8_9FIRM|nr:permease-like cell division protein FtsX [[Clostridium] fimetarium]SEV82961.1 cell division transport system permease protein [[Clostridium] fimetarium]
MRIRSLAYNIKQGLKNIYRNRMFSLASIATITACLFLFGVFYAILTNFQYMVQKAESSVCVTVFFDEGVNDQQVQDIGKNIQSRVEVSNIHFTSSQEAWDKFQKEYFGQYADLAEGFKDDNPLANSASYEVYLNDASMQTTLVTYLENMDGIRQVNKSDITASSLSSVAVLVGYASVVIIIILLAVSIFLITNTIVIGVTVRKEEISIMKLIGATDMFVDAPFIVEGLTIGIVGSLLPLLLLHYLYSNLVGFVLSKFSLLNNILAFLPSETVFATLIPISIGLGIGIGSIGSYLALRKHVNV